MAASRGIRLRSWDRFLVPAPFCRLGYVYGEPMRISRELDDAGLEAGRQQLEEVLNDLTARAGEMVGGGV